MRRQRGGLQPDPARGRAPPARRSAGTPRTRCRRSRPRRGWPGAGRASRHRRVAASASGPVRRLSAAGRAGPREDGRPQHRHRVPEHEAGDGEAPPLAGVRAGRQARHGAQASRPGWPGAARGGRTRRAAEAVPEGRLGELPQGERGRAATRRRGAAAPGTDVAARGGPGRGAHPAVTPGWSGSGVPPRSRACARVRAEGARRRGYPVPPEPPGPQQLTAAPAGSTS